MTFTAAPLTEMLSNSVLASDIYIYTYIDMYIYVHIYTDKQFIYVYVYICIFVYVYIHIYVYRYIARCRQEAAGFLSCLNALIRNAPSSGPSWFDPFSQWTACKGGLVALSFDYSASVGTAATAAKDNAMIRIPHEWLLWPGLHPSDEHALRWNGSRGPIGGLEMCHVSQRRWRLTRVRVSPPPQVSISEAGDGEERADRKEAVQRQPLRLHLPLRARRGQQGRGQGPAAASAAGIGIGLALVGSM